MSFMKPANGTITSGFRTASRPNHHGIDIAKGGNVPVVASERGVVHKSYYSSSYGNVLFIAHQLNGALYETVYAHLKKRIVEENQIVQQGQVIGYMGNTGNSTGQHLHFEIHKGLWNVKKSNAVDPIKWIRDEKNAVENRKSIVPYPDQLIKLGSRGKDVERIQRAVNVTVDGIFGPITESAVKNYQRRHGLTVDGIVGPLTWEVLF